MYKIIIVKLNGKYYYIHCNKDTAEELIHKIRNIKSLEEFEAIKETLFQYDADLLDGEYIEMYIYGGERD